MGKWKYTIDAGQMVAMLFCIWMAATGKVSPWLVALVWAPTFKASLKFGG